MRTFLITNIPFYLGVFSLFCWAVICRVRRHGPIGGYRNSNENNEPRD